MADERNLISEIREAEKTAEEMIEKARIEGEALIEKIRKEQKESSAAAEEDAMKEGALMLEKAREDSEKEALRMRGETEAVIAVLKSGADKRMARAAEFLLGKILE